MRHRFSTWKMTPVLGVVKADIFENVSCNRPSWYKTYQLSGSHTVEALSPKKSICAQKAINFSIPTKIVVAARQNVKSQLHVGKQPTFFSPALPSEYWTLSVNNWKSVKDVKRKLTAELSLATPKQNKQTKNTNKNPKNTNTMLASNRLRIKQ